MAQAADLPGAAHLELVDGVVHLDPKPAMLEAMLAGWARQQQTRFLSEAGTIQPRIALVRRLVEFTNAYPWEWRSADAEAFITRLRSPNGRKPIAMSTGRGYETTLALFMAYLTDRRYGWLEVCRERFGDIPEQIFHDDNRVAHVVGKAPQYRQYGSLLVRYGKASRGSPPKRRTVLTAPEMDWIVDVLDQWVTEIRPLFSPGKHPALFVTERAGRMSLRGLNAAFSQASEAAGLAPELDLHSLRHSYVTHLVEFDYPERFVQDQVGHAYASTTAIYTGVSDEYRNRLLERSLRNRYGELWEERP